MASWPKNLSRQTGDSARIALRRGCRPVTVLSAQSRSSTGRSAKAVVTVVLPGPGVTGVTLPGAVARMSDRIRATAMARVRSPAVHGTMTRRGWALFGAMSAIWGIPYLLIKVAVEDLEPPVVVFGRTSLAAVVLARARLAPARAAARARALALGPRLRRHRDGRPVVPAHPRRAAPAVGPDRAARGVRADRRRGHRVPLGDRDALRLGRLLGIGVGLGGVALIVGGDLGADGGVPWWQVTEVLLVCVGYATAPFIAPGACPTCRPSASMRRLAVGRRRSCTLPLAWWQRPDDTPPADALWAVSGSP